MKELTLYPGDNGQQEFFEDADSTLAIIRPHGVRKRLEGTEHQDRGWWVHGNDPLSAWFSDVQGTLEEVLKGLEEHEIKATIDRSKVWVLPFARAKRMKLVDAGEKG